MEEKQQNTQGGADLSLIFALVALCLIVLYKILFAFGVWSGVLFAIMAVVVYGLTIAGAILGYLKDKKYTLGVLLNVALFFAALLIM